MKDRIRENGNWISRACESGSFYALIIETFKNGKNILYNTEVFWIYCR